MKRLILILLLAFIINMLIGCKAEAIEPDKSLHYGASLIISTATALYAQNKEYKYPMLTGFAVAMAVGVAKELSDDHVDNKDLMFDAFGAVTPMVLTWRF